jgi:hypothetical protein
LSTEQVHQERLTWSDNWHSKFQRPDRDATLVEARVRDQHGSAAPDSLVELTF